MIKYIFFDMDGVLIDAREWHYLAFNKALEKNNLKPINIDDHILYFDGLPTNKKIMIYQKKYNSIINKKQIKKINKLKQKYTMKIARKKLNKDDDKIQLLSYLKNNNIKIACCSNSIKKSINFFLKKAGIYDFFDLILSNNDVKFPKPDPEIYLKALQFFNVNEKKEVLIFEDNENGIKAANSSGCNVHIIKNPSDLVLENVKLILNNYEKI